MNHYLDYSNYLIRIQLLAIIILYLFILPINVKAQEEKSLNYERDTLLTAAREVMQEARYCGLITLDNAGQPHVRTMDPFTPEENLVVWFGTNSNSRKVKEIRNDARVSLYYVDPEGSGYVVIGGLAHIIDDPDEKTVHWKKEWEAYYKNQKEAYILIKVVPEKIEIVSYKHGITGDPVAWKVPIVKFESND